MISKKIKIILLFLLFFQTPIFSKNNNSQNLDPNNLSKYFSGIVAFDNDNNSDALKYLNSSKILTDIHDPFLEKFIITLILENRVVEAINLMKLNKEKLNANFFEGYILLVIDSLKKNKIDDANEILLNMPEFLKQDRFNFIISKSLEQYIFTFREKKILEMDERFGNLSLINETFQRCYLGDRKTSAFFSQLINSNQADYSRYIYFYMSHLIEKNEFKEAQKLSDSFDYINATLLLSQGKSWIKKNQYRKFKKIFSCENSNDILGEFFFLVSNLYSSQEKFTKSNFFLSLSNYLNPKFIFNLSLAVENLYFNENYKKAKIILKNFNKVDNFYYWYRIRKESQIYSKEKNQEEALKYITSNFNKLDDINNKFIFDIANFYKQSKKYNEAIKYYSLIIDSLDENSDLLSDLLYRRGGSYERLNDFTNSDKDLLNSLKINPDDAYVLNYLAYSWLERDYKIDEAIEMLEKAYSIESDDPYIIDSIGWAYYLIDDFIKAEKYLKRAVELMPDDPIVNDHYGDILWKLDRKIQARYFWSVVLKMEDIEKELINKISNKLITGPEKT